jgi:DNA repair exonuclease SbcCD ATPase subunit
LGWLSMKIKNLSLKGFGKFDEEINFNFIERGIHVITGKNGSGKSTLFKAIMAILTGLSEKDKDRFLKGSSWGRLTLQNGRVTICLHRNFVSDEIEIFNLENGTQRSDYIGKNNLHTRTEPNYLRILSKYIANLNIDVLENVSFISQQTLATSPDRVFTRMKNHNNQSNLNFIIQDLQIFYDNTFGDEDHSNSQQSQLPAYEQQLYEKQKIVERINAHVNKQKASHDEIRRLEAQLSETIKAEEIQTKQLDRLEKLCEYINQENQIQERFTDLHQQKSRIDDIENEIQALKEELESQYPKMWQFSGIQLKQDIYRWKELKEKQNNFENQLAELAQQRMHLENEIAKEIHQYQNVGPNFSMELTQYRQLTEEENKKHTNLKRLFFKIESEKKKLTHQQLFNFILITAGTVIISIFQLNLNISFNVMMMISIFIFCFSIVIIDKWLWCRRRINIQEHERMKNELNEEIRIIELKRQEMGLRYYRLQNIEKTDQHIVGYSNYRQKQRKLDELVTSANIIRAQLTTPGLQEMVAYYQKRYGNEINLEDPDLFEKIDNIIQCQQKISGMKHALTTHRKKELLITKESELEERQESMREQIEGFFTENAQLRHLMENTQEINRELQYAEEQVEKLTLKQNQLSKEIQQRKIELASISDFGGINLMHLQDDVRFLQEKTKRLNFDKEVLNIVIEGYHSVRKEYNRTFCESLNKLINIQFQELCKSDTIRISLKEDLHLKIWELEKLVFPEQLNMNMRMLLSLAARFALINYLSDDITLPIFLDDPFISFDSEKRSGIEQILRHMAKTHQIVLFTIDEHYKKWGDLNDILA